MDVAPDMTRAMKTFRGVSRYGTAVGRVMVHEGSLLDWQRVDRLLESDFDGSIAVLADTDYAPYLLEAKTASEVEEGLLSFLGDQYRLLDEMSPDGFLSDFMHLKYDFHNTVAVLRRAHGDGEATSLLPGLGSLDTERIEASAESRGSGNLPAYWEEVVASLKALLLGGAGPQEVDTAAERAYLERRLALASAEKSRFLVDYARASIDLANLKVLLRGRALGKNGGYYESAMAGGGRMSRSELAGLASESYESLSSRLLVTRYGRVLEEVLSPEDRIVRLTTLDRESEEFLLEKLAGMKRMAIGPERIIRYALLREDEVAMLRVILFSKLYGVSTGAVARRLNPSFLSGGTQ